MLKSEGEFGEWKKKSNYSAKKSLQRQTWFLKLFRLHVGSIGGLKKQVLNRYMVHTLRQKGG